MKKIGLAAAVLFAMTGAHAYQVEVQGQSEYLDINSSANNKNYTGDLKGTYYFKDVDSSKGPLAEAAFLNKASNVSLGYHYGEFNYSRPEGNPNFNYQDNSFGVKGEAYFTTPYTGSLPLYTSASYNHTHLDGKNAISPDNNGDRYALEVGAEPIKNFLVAVGYTRANPIALDTTDILTYGIAKTYGEATYSGDHKDFVTARAKYVGAIDNTNMALGFEAKGIFNNDRGAYGLKTDLYLNPALSVGVSFADTSNLHSDFDHVWGANVNYFITPAIAVGASYVKANAKNGNTLDTDTYGLNALVRF